MGPKENSVGNVDIRGWQDDVTPVNIGADINKALLVAGGTPAGVETARRGNSWTVQTVTAFAPLVAFPTTVTILEVYNNTANTGLSIRDLFAWQVLGTAATQTYSIWAMVTTTKVVPSLTALNLFSMSGKNFVTTTAAGPIVTGVGTTIVANGWRPYGGPNVFSTAAALPGNGWSHDIDGKIVVPYGCSLCLHIVGTLATGSSFLMGTTFDIIEGYTQLA